MLYDYKCDKCNKTIEVSKRMNDPAPEVHNGCGGHLYRVYTFRNNKCQIQKPIVDATKKWCTEYNAKNNWKREIKKVDD